MATKQRRRRKRSGASSGELYQIVQGKHVLVEKQYPDDASALSFAQNFIAKIGLGVISEKRVEYDVRLVPVLGPPDLIYRIVLTPEGVILTLPAGAAR